MKAGNRLNDLAKGRRVHNHGPLAQHDPDEFDEDECYGKNAPKKLEYYSSDEGDRKPPARLNLDRDINSPSDNFHSTRADLPPPRSTSSKETFQDNDNGIMDVNLGESFEYKGKNKKKWAQEDFMKQLEANNSNTPSMFSGISKTNLLTMALAVTVGIVIYINANTGGFQFHGLASGRDDDDDDCVIDSFPIEKEPSPETLPLDEEASSPGSDSSRVGNGQNAYHFDQDATMNQHDAFHVSDANWYGGIFSDPPHPSIPSHLLHNHDDDDSLKDNIGYMQDPHIYNDTMVFCSEGDVYLTTISAPQGKQKKALPAMRLTSTVGNVNTPTINPKYPYLVAFTATYTGHREVYLMDLRSNHRSKPSMRLTYTDTEYGVFSVIDWEDDGTSLVFGTTNREVAMEDQRLYKIGIVQEDADHDAPLSRGNRKRKISEQGRLADAIVSPITVSSVEAIPLSQAIDSTVDEDSNCRYFTRFKQSSNTIRYVGGTAESLWAYCEGEELAVPLTKDYVGTSKKPKLYLVSGKKYLLFLSDRADINGEKWASTSMNLWAAPLPKKRRMYKKEEMANMARPFVLTSISCIDGMQIQEFAVDSANGNIVLRIGADLHTLSAKDITDSITLEGKTSKLSPSKLPIAVYSDFNHLHERLIPLRNPLDVTTIDVFDGGYGMVSALMAARGQLFVNPVVDDISDPSPYGGGGMNIPQRRYRVAPGSTTGGMVRIFGAWFIANQQSSLERTALILATDPMSMTAEIAFFLVDAAAGSAVNFADVHNLPKPLVGGHTSNESESDTRLGSIKVESVSVSPCGRRVAWADIDGLIRVMALPVPGMDEKVSVHDLPQVNESGEPVLGIEATLVFSPSGRYIAIEHNARNQFRVISIADLGDPAASKEISTVRVAQATPDRFNSVSPFWGQVPVDFQVEKIMPTNNDPRLATTLYFLSDRDVVLTGNSSPWGTRAPSPYFNKQTSVYALPLVSRSDEMDVDPIEEVYRGNYVGGGALELMGGHVDSWTEEIEKEKNDFEDENLSDIPVDHSVPFVTPDVEISFGDPDNNLSFARRAYLVSEIPASNYLFLHQLSDDPSIILAEAALGAIRVNIFAIGDFPGNHMTGTDIELPTTLQSIGMSTNRKFMYFTYNGKTKIVPNDVASFSSLFMSDATFTRNIIDTDRWAVSVWPKLEYQQMYSDAWRMLRDYYYAKDMGSVDWNAIHDRYLPLLARCGRREELDDVLKQMAAELSALHVFVYGGEYNDPMHGNLLLKDINAVASLGAVLERSAEWSGYVVKDVPERDPDFNPLDGKMMYSPLSERTLRHSGQRGLLPGDVIVGVNGESVMNVPDIHMLLRGMQGRSVRLDVLRVKSKSSFSFNRKRKMQVTEDAGISAEPVIVVPISGAAAEDLKYSAWEWKTRDTAKGLAKDNGFSVGYMHLRSMSGLEGEDAYVRGFYPDYDKEALIVDVRHNRGGNIDSWLLDSLQRKAWSYWQGRATNITNGGLGWDEQFAFRGHIVVLIDEKTSSDGEGFSRGVSELGLGKLVGTRTWGGGIWLSSDNHLVDGGIATAPEIGTYNDNFGWGLGIEQMGITPDVEVDNNPRTTFDGKDEQLEKAIEVLTKWLEDEPLVPPKSPGPHKNMSMRKEFESCGVN